METIIRNIGDIDANDIEALEHVLGKRLGENQQLVIGIVNLEVPQAAAPQSSGQPSSGGSVLPEWCNVYAGLSDHDVADIERIILQRCDLSRPSE